MRQQKIEEKKPITIMGVRQNCYVVPVLSAQDGMTVNPSKTIAKYTMLEKQQLPNGYTEAVVEKDYPINSASVTSYADGADYRNDPAQAIANASKRVNLGDVTQAQEFMSNPQNYANIAKTTLDGLRKYYESLQQQSQKQPQEDKGGKE